MGCKSAKPKAEDPSQEASQGASHNDSSDAKREFSEDAQAPSHSPAPEHERAGMTTKPSFAPRVGSAAVRSILEEAKAVAEQLRFFDAWDEVVLKHLAQSNSANVVVSTDLAFLEVRIEGPADQMVKLARQFIKRCRVPPELAEQMAQLQTETQAESATLWCKFKNMAEHSEHEPPQGRAPSVDAGFTINSEIEWIVADMLMPAVEDQDSLRDYAVQELHAPNTFGSSIFPVEPEKCLTFEMSGGISRKLLHSAFFFFKSLGFAKPEDAVVRVLSSCKSQKFIISVFIGPKGLTRLAVSLCEPNRPQIASELAECLRKSFKRDGIERIAQILKSAEVEFVDYIAESTGYSVGIGFMLSGFEHDQ